MTEALHDRILGSLYGVASLMIGANDGTGVLPTLSGNCASACEPRNSAPVAIEARTTVRRLRADCVM